MTFQECETVRSCAAVAIELLKQLIKERVC